MAKEKSHWIFISTHFDDTALSCGGLVWDLARQGQCVEVWTIMGGYPLDASFSAFAQETHQHWGAAGKAAIDLRRREDEAACAILGAQHRHLGWPDVIYRRDPQTGAAMVNNNEELFGKLPEKTLVEEIVAFLASELPQTAEVVFPFGLGGHLDHRAVAQVSKRLPDVRHRYADYPYILAAFEELLLQEAWQPIPRPLSEQALAAWQAAVLCYRSQLSGLWQEENDVLLALRNYLAGGGGRLWARK